AALVLGVGPGAEVAQQGVGLALGREVGHALLRRLGGFAQRLLGLVQEAHVPPFSRARRPWWTAGAYATGRGALRRLSGGGLGRGRGRRRPGRAARRAPSGAPGARRRA